MQQGFLDRAANTRRKRTKVAAAEGSVPEPEGGSILTPSDADELVPPSVDRIKADRLTPRQFWLEHVSHRKPLLIEGHLQEKGWKATRKWTNEHMMLHAHNAEVDVEDRSSSGGSFGQGKKRTMCFSSFLERVKAGEEDLYLTTQTDRKAPDGHPEFMSHLLLCLGGDYPIRPQLAASLVPYQVNVWIGASKSGSSSRLHHDYHDNLYILLRGHKRFRLFPPSMARRMYTHGQIKIVHPNGRIVYEGQGNVAADGSRPAAARRAMSFQLQERIGNAETALSAVDRQLERAATKEEAARLEAKYHRLEDMIERLEAELDAFQAEQLEGSDDEDEEDDYMPLDPDELQMMRSPDGDENSDKDPDDAPQPEPDSFSCVDLNADPAELAKHFPDFPGAAAALTVELKAGEMLYLPAGWFHEVTSYGEQHMAFNYWFHPPDNLTRQGFLKPYTTDFWPMHFQQRFGKDQ